MGYFDAAYFDPAYFDTGSGAAAGSVRRGITIGPYAEPEQDEELLVTLALLEVP